MMEKIIKCRQLYITKYGREPKGVIVGMKILDEANAKAPERFLQAGGTILGMKIIVDKDKPGRVEVGDFAV